MKQTIRIAWGVQSILELGSIHAFTWFLRDWAYLQRLGVGNSSQDIARCPLNKSDDHFHDLNTNKW
jgi:hypothetical protein